MAENDPGNDGPSLELPSLGFKRRKQRAARSAEPEGTPEPEPEAPLPSEPEPVQVRVEPDPPTDSTEPAEDRGPRVTLPAIGGMASAAATGLVVGGLLVALVWGSLRGCELVRGTSSCGQPGFLVLLAILALLVVVGRALLRGFGVADPGSTSLLGVGVVAVVVLLFLTGSLFQWWIALVVPVVTVASFALAHWVSSAFVEPPEGNLHR